MLIIKHRVNSLRELSSVPLDCGVEVDLHFSDDRIYVGHDPQGLTLDFNTYLSNFKHKFIALNIKEEGIEESVLESLRDHQINEYFLFDLSFPSIVRLMDIGEKRIAIRLSDFENIRDFTLLEDKIEWLWIDVFRNADFLNHTEWMALSAFKKCLVSPELHLNREKVLTEEIQKSLFKHIERFDAVCTKNQSLWASIS